MILIWQTKSSRVYFSAKALVNLFYCPSLKSDGNDFLHSSISLPPVLTDGSFSDSRMALAKRRYAHTSAIDFFVLILDSWFLILGSWLFSQ